MIKIKYDREGDILEIKFTEERIEESEYIKESGIVIDYDKGNKIVGIEILSFSKRTHQEKIAEIVGDVL